MLESFLTSQASYSPGGDDCFAASNLLHLRVIQFDDALDLRDLLLVLLSVAFIDTALNCVHGLLPLA
jgi:hypothetical protein